ncbi:hypothetical protein M0R89_21725 (plasmid) [Halorussus limi]|uniref:Uncharacterized protein n=2 Tax=Halobacteriales TaxID=2235 RepID=A0A8U0I2F1_9EURY|nr:MULTISPECIES: hypothetical protein [Halobacteriales]UPV77041.1 hypothetical protein M0R89_21725 [Halorussus limi]
MTDNTEPVSQSTGGGSIVNVNPSTAEGRSRVLLFGGLAWLALGHLVDIALVVWGGVGLIAVAFALNTAGKVVHYRSLSIPSRDHLTLSATWTLLAVTVVALLANFAHTRYGPGDGAYFWSLAVAGVGFGLLHMAAQSKYLPESAVQTD